MEVIYTLHGVKWLDCIDGLIVYMTLSSHLFQNHFFIPFEV